MKDKTVKSGARNSKTDLALGREAKAKLRAAQVANDEALAALDAMGIFDDEPSESEGTTPAAKLAYVKRLHIPQDDEYMRDVVAVKSVARDTIRGYSMLWGNPELTDLETEFFTKSTDFWDKQLLNYSRPLTWEHGQDPATKSASTVGQIMEFGDDDVGRWYVAQLDRSHKYRKAIDALISKREVGTSSDSAPQYVLRSPAGKGVWLKQWPWFASALTTTPCEPRMMDEGSLHWKAIGIDVARMGALDNALSIPAELLSEGKLLQAKVSVL